MGAYIYQYLCDYLYLSEVSSKATLEVINRRFVIHQS